MDVFLWVAGLRIVAALLALSIVYPSALSLWRRLRRLEPTAQG